MLSELDDGDHPGITCVSLLHRGELFVERYFKGAQVDDLQNTRSASKAITSALVGIVIDRGELSSVENLLATVQHRCSKEPPSLRVTRWNRLSSCSSMQLRWNGAGDFGVARKGQIYQKGSQHVPVAQQDRASDS
jgi:hypothetical protein